MNTVKINQLAVETTIGCLAWERQTKQTLVVDIEYCADFNRISQHDSITNAVNYAELADHVTQFAAHTDAKLLETWAQRLALTLSEQFKLSWLALTIHKHGALPNARGVSVSLIWPER